MLCNKAERPLVGELQVVTTALVWNAARANPVVDAIVARVRAAGEAAR